MDWIIKEFDKLLKERGIAVSLLFILIELIYTNSKSLYYLDSTSHFGNNGSAGWTFSVFGAIGISFVSTVVMRQPNRSIAKNLLPIFDAAFVFCAFNINLFTDIDTGAINPVRVILSLFLAVFVGYSIYTMGELSFQQHESNVANNKGNYDELQRNYSDLQRNYTDLQRNYEVCHPAYLKQERARILKKAKHNLTEKEKQFLIETN